MARKWLLNGALASIFATYTVSAMLTGVSAGPIAVAYAWDQGAARIDPVPAAQLPREAQDTLARIAAGGPYPYEKDGVVFGNYERILPWHRRGYYHEYTVPTPFAHNRGARRIVCGGPQRQIGECYYSGDHYVSFKRIIE
jgi:ribonuclease T1